METEFEYKGVWWLPGNQEDEYSGNVKFSTHNGVTLEIIGSFRDDENIHAPKNPTIIQGILATGRYVTLYECQESNFSKGFPGFEQTTYLIKIMYLGVAFNNKEDIKFNKISIHFSDLNEWVNISGFEISRNFEKKQTKIEYKLPTSIKSRLSDGVNILIEFEHTGPIDFSIQNNVNIEQTTFFSLETDTPTSFDQYLFYLYHIRNFLSLGISNPVFPLVIKGSTDENIILFGNEEFRDTVEIYYQQYDFPEIITKRHPHEMLFTFKDISQRFEKFIQNWFDKIELLEPIYDLYFGTLYNPKSYIQSKFLSLVNALESFHRRVIGGVYIEKDIYEKIITVLLETIPTDIDKNLKNSLKGKLMYGNEFSLRKRLLELFDRYYDILNQYIKSKDSFVQKVVSTRNYLNHYNKDLKSNSVSGSKLYYITEQLKIILEVSLLDELGFSIEEIGSLMSNNRGFQKDLLMNYED